MKNTISIELDQEEILAISQILDAAIKHLGGGGVKMINHFQIKIEEAIKISNEKELLKQKIT